jgi:hypothetical protein
MYIYIDPIKSCESTIFKAGQFFRYTFRCPSVTPRRRDRNLQAAIGRSDAGPGLGGCHSAILGPGCKFGSVRKIIHIILIQIY